MRAKILYAEEKTDEALGIYRTKFVNWYATSGQKTEQLFPKDTAEYYFYMRKNMYELADFAADKLGRTVFFDPSLSMEQKTERALRYGELLRSAYDETERPHLSRRLRQTDCGGDGSSPVGAERTADAARRQ